MDVAADWTAATHGPPLDLGTSTCGGKGCFPRILEPPDSWFKWIVAGDIYIYVGLVAIFNTKRLEVFPRPNELNGIE